MTNRGKKAEVQNAIQGATLHYCRHMIPGVAAYDNKDGTQTLYYTDLDGIKTMIPTGPGIPVFIGHVDDINLDTLKTDAHGYVTESFYNPLDGWAWFKLLINDDAARAAIAKNWSVSNAFIPEQVAGGGTHINVNYDKQVLNGRFTHLAIVPDPRYEGAKIYSPEEFKAYQAGKTQELEQLKNSKTTTKGKKMNFFKMKREEVSDIDDDTMLELANGKSVSVKTLSTALDSEAALKTENAKLKTELANAKKNSEAEDDKEKADKADDVEKKNAAEMVKVNGEDVSMKDLIDCYQNSKSKKNSEDDKEDDKDDEKKNESDADKKDDADSEKKNSKGDEADHFKELKNARNNKGEVITIMTGQDKVAIGKARYGSE